MDSLELHDLHDLLRRWIRENVADRRNGMYTAHARQLALVIDQQANATAWEEATNGTA